MEGISSTIICVVPSGTGKSATILGGTKNEGIVDIILKEIGSMEKASQLHFQCQEILESKIDMVKSYVDNKLAKAEHLKTKKKIVPHLLHKSNNHSRPLMEESKYTPIINKSKDTLQMIKDIIKMRTIASMKSNLVSSRGHLCIFKNCRELVPTNGIITILDIAGNEDFVLSERKDETKMINLQNSTLADIIRASIKGRKNTVKKTNFTDVTRKAIKICSET